MLILKHGSTLVFSIIGVYGFSILQNPHVVEANKDANYLDLAKENCILTNDMQFVRVEGTVNTGTVGNYEVYYIVKDENNNEINSEKVTVNIVDTIAPTLHFADDPTGTVTEKSIVLQFGQQYKEEMANMIATDNSSIVNIRLLGDESKQPTADRPGNDYVMVYQAEDGVGKVSQKLTVHITVLEQEEQPKIMYLKDADFGEYDYIENYTGTEGKPFTTNVVLYCSTGKNNQITYEIMYKETNESEATKKEYQKNMILKDNGIYTVIAYINGEKRQEVTFEIRK